MDTIANPEPRKELGPGPDFSALCLLGGAGRQLDPSMKPCRCTLRIWIGIFEHIVQGSAHERGRSFLFIFDLQP